MKNGRFKVAVALNKAMARSILSAEDYSFLKSFAEVNPVDDLPETMTIPFMETILEDAEACVTCWGTPGLTDEMLANAPKLRLIAHAAGSVKALVPDSFWETGCRITSNAPVIAEDVAQTVLAFILCSFKGLWRHSRFTQSGGWGGGKSGFAARRLDGLFVGIVGASNTGRETAKILKPFGCKIKLYDPYASPMEAESIGAELTGLSDLLATCDVVSLHAPATEECRRLIDGNTAPLFKDGALFINTARGMLVDEAALVRELERGRIFACIDVTDPEPPAEDHPFRKLENVILTPHIAGGQTVNGRLMLGRSSVNEIYGYLHKGVLKYEVRREMMERMA